MTTKHFFISGLAFDFKIFDSDHWLAFLNSGERVDMEKLQKLAKQGWIVKRIKNFSYVLELETPQALKFAVDYKDKPDLEYFELFEAAGWTHVDSIDYIHLFKAPLEAPELASDVETRIAILTQEMNRYRKRTLPASIFFISALFVAFLPVSQTWPSFIQPLLISVFWIYFVYNSFPVIGYWSRLKSLQKSIK